jgi:hypothetical protein
VSPVVPARWLQDRHVHACAFHVLQTGKVELSYEYVRQFGHVTDEVACRSKLHKHLQRGVQGALNETRSKMLLRMLKLSQHRQDGGVSCAADVPEDADMMELHA